MSLKQKSYPWYQRIRAILSSSWLFWAVLLFFVLQAGWLAVSGRYPMPFDEDFHIGIIRLYANHMSPFWQTPPDGSEVFGIVSRDPSYLYHFLMSFPYRLIVAITDNLQSQIVALRFINITLFAYGIYLFRALLRNIGSSRALTNSVLAVFILIPVVPLLASQINYDNLMFPLVALTLILASRIINRIEKLNEFDLIDFILLISIGAYTSLVKFAYLPIFLALLMYLIYVVFHHIKSFSNLKISFKKSYLAANKAILLLSLIILALAAGLFVERYAVNASRYHAPIPECSKVLSEQKCASYGPWLRDHNFALSHTKRSYNVIKFEGEWLYGMWLRSFFSLGGILTDYETRGPFPVPAISAVIFVVIGLVLLLKNFKMVFQKYDSHLLKMVTFITFMYILLLWLEEFRAFSKTGQPVAINGRYLVPVLPIILFLLAAAINTELGNRVKYKIISLIIVITCLAYGGGAATYILRANSGWYWQNSSVQRLNLNIKRNVGPWVLGYQQQNFMLR